MKTRIAEWKRFVAVALVCAALCAWSARDAVAETEAQSPAAAYVYDQALPLNPDLKLVNPTPGNAMYHLAFDSTNEERVTAVLHVPANRPAPYPAVIVQHGYNGAKDMGSAFAAFLCPRGYLVIAIDMEYHGERAEPGKDVMSPDSKDDARALSQSVIDLRRTVDYLASRGDVDMDRIGYIGVSLGSFIGVVFTAVEPRIRTAVFVVGGGGWKAMADTSGVGALETIRNHYKAEGLDTAAFAADLQVVEPLRFAPLLAPRPVLMINCSNDKYVPKPTAEALYAALGDPKDIRWFTCEGDIGHIPPMDKTLNLAVKWYKNYLNSSR